MLVIETFGTNTFKVAVVVIVFSLFLYLFSLIVFIKLNMTIS